VVADPLWTLHGCEAERAEQVWRECRICHHQGNPFEKLLRERLQSTFTPPRCRFCHPVVQLFGFWRLRTIRWIEPKRGRSTRPMISRAFADGCWMLAYSLLPSSTR